MMLGLLLVIRPSAVYPIVHKINDQNTNARKDRKRERWNEKKVKEMKWGEIVLD